MSRRTFLKLLGGVAVTGLGEVISSCQKSSSAAIQATVQAMEQNDEILNEDLIPIEIRETVGEIQTKIFGKADRTGTFMLVGADKEEIFITTTKHILSEIFLDDQKDGVEKSISAHMFNGAGQSWTNGKDQEYRVIQEENNPLVLIALKNKGIASLMLPETGINRKILPFDKLKPDDELLVVEYPKEAKGNPFLSKPRYVGPEKNVTIWEGDNLTTNPEIMLKVNGLASYGSSGSPVFKVINSEPWLVGFVETNRDNTEEAFLTPAAKLGPLMKQLQINQ